MRRTDPRERRIVFVQAGDYAEAVLRFAAGGSEDYYAQRYTVDYLAGLAARWGAASVVTFSRDLAFQQLPNGVGAAGVLLYPPGGRARHGELIRAVERLSPTDLVVVAPVRPLLRWALRRQIRVLPLFADSFRRRGLASRLRYFLLRRLLNRPAIRFVANHNLAASRDLQRIGVDPRKILPFDWPPLVSPADYAAKDAPGAEPFRLLFVGLLLESKGAGDLLRALPRLPQCTLTLVGAGPDEAALRSLAGALGVAARVDFRGKIAHARVLAEMRAHDAVVVASRWDYPEGLPMTLYEALCTRTPLVVSDHPMFRERMVHEGNALVFGAGDEAALAAAVERLRTEAGLYRALSTAGGAAAEGFLCPLQWHALLDLWLDGGAAAEAELASCSLANQARAR